jgi:hypothetical protein
LAEQSWELGSLVIPTLMVEAKNPKTVETLSSVLLDAMCDCVSPKEILLWSLQVVSTVTQLMLDNNESDLEDEQIVTFLRIFLAYSNLWINGIFLLKSVQGGHNANGEETQRWVGYLEKNNACLSVPFS